MTEERASEGGTPTTAALGVAHQRDAPAAQEAVGLKRLAPRTWSSVRSAGLMSAGTLLVGAAGYAFIALAGNTLPTGEAAAVSSFYMLVNILGPGVFMALEQETNRAISSVALKSGLVVRRAAVRGVALLATVLVVLGVLSPLLVSRSLLGHWDLFVAIVTSTVTAAAVYLVRGVLAGRRQFTGYAATLAAEGLMRLLPAVVIAVAGWAAVGSYGIAFALGSGFGAVAGFAWLRRGSGGNDGGAQSDSEPLDEGKVRGLAPLVGATLLAQVVANVTPVVVTARMANETAMAAAFASGFVLARVPLFVFSPVQAVIVPAVAAAVATRDGAKVRRIVRAGGLAAAGLGLAGTVLIGLLGPWVLRTFFGTKVPISGSVLALLGLGTTLLITVQVCQAALVAFRAHVAVTAWWQGSVAVLAAFLALPIDPVRAAVAGQVAGSAVVVVGMLVTLRARLRDHTGEHISESRRRYGT